MDKIKQHIQDTLDDLQDKPSPRVWESVSQKLDTKKKKTLFVLLKPSIAACILVSCTFAAIKLITVYTIHIKKGKQTGTSIGKRKQLAQAPVYKDTIDTVKSSLIITGSTVDTVVIEYINAEISITDTGQNKPEIFLYNKKQVIQPAQYARLGITVVRRPNYIFIRKDQENKTKLLSVKAVIKIPSSRSIILKQISAQVSMQGIVHNLNAEIDDGVFYSATIDTVKLQARHSTIHIAQSQWADLTLQNQSTAKYGKIIHAVVNMQFSDLIIDSVKTVKAELRKAAIQVKHIDAFDATYDSAKIVINKLKKKLNIHGSYGEIQIRKLKPTVKSLVIQNKHGTVWVNTRDLWAGEITLCNSSVHNMVAVPLRFKLQPAMNGRYPVPCSTYRTVHNFMDAHMYFNCPDTQIVLSEENKNPKSDLF